MKRLETTIPFSGFYQTLHDSEIYTALEQSFSDDGGSSNCEILNHEYEAVEWRAVYENYAQEYCARFGEEFKIRGLVFDCMRSPKEYNFSTDRIFATLDIEELRRIYSRVTPENLAETACEKFTSRSGFISFYSPDVSTWGDLETWDHNQAGTLIEALANQENQSAEIFDIWAEHALMENALCNGKLENWIFSSNPQKLKRLDKINRYLVARAEQSHTLHLN